MGAGLCIVEIGMQVSASCRAQALKGQGDPSPHWARERGWCCLLKATQRSPLPFPGDFLRLPPWPGMTFRSYCRPGNTPAEANSNVGLLFPTVNALACTYHRSPSTDRWVQGRPFARQVARTSIAHRSARHALPTLFPGHLRQQRQPILPPPVGWRELGKGPSAAPSRSRCP